MDDNQITRLINSLTQIGNALWLVAVAIIIHGCQTIISTMGG